MTTILHSFPPSTSVQSFIPQQQHNQQTTPRPYSISSFQSFESHNSLMDHDPAALWQQSTVPAASASLDSIGYLHQSTSSMPYMYPEALDTSQGSASGYQSQPDAYSDSHYYSNTTSHIGSQAYYQDNNPSVYSDQLHHHQESIGRPSGYPSSEYISPSQLGGSHVVNRPMTPPAQVAASSSMHDFEFPRLPPPPHTDGSQSSDYEYGSEVGSEASYDEFSTDIDDDYVPNIDDRGAVRNSRAGPRTRTTSNTTTSSAMIVTKKSRGRHVPVNQDTDGGIPILTTTISTEDADTTRRSRRRAASGINRAASSSPHPRPFPCEVCGKCFRRGEHLKRHVRSIHTDERPYGCPSPGCDKRFSRRDNLAQHTKVHNAGRIRRE